MKTEAYIYKTDGEYVGSADLVAVPRADEVLVVGPMKYKVDRVCYPVTLKSHGYNPMNEYVELYVTQID